MRGWRHNIKRDRAIPRVAPYSSSGGQQGRLIARQRAVNQCGGKSVAVEVGRRVLLVPAHTVRSFV